MREQSVKNSQAKQRRAQRVRRHLRGTSTKPRLTVHKSNRNLFAQIIDDERGITLAGVGTLSKGFKGTDNGRRSVAAASALGKCLADMARKKGINAVIFDRGRFKYTGTLSALADAARKAGLQF